MSSTKSISAPNSEVFRGDIQGLRAIAVLAVIVFHVNKEWLPGGFVGVDVFFAISGFLIGGILLRKMQSGTFSLLDFYVGRLRRIVPAYAVLIAITSIFASIIFISKDFGYFKSSANSAAYFLSNRYFGGFGDYFAPTAHELPLLHTWSLAVEMQFYLVFPIALILLPHRLRGGALMAAAVVLLGFGLREVALGKKQVAYFSLLVRIPEFLLGAYLAVIESRRAQESLQKLISRYANWIGALGLFLLLGSFWLINEDSAFPGAWVLAPCIGAVAVMGAKNSAISRGFAHPVLVWIGGLSYSLYLWHWPILAFLRYITEGYQLSFLLLVFFSLLLLLVSYVSWRWIEIPYRRHEVRTASLVWRLLVLTAGVAIPIFFAPIVNAAIDKPLPIEYMRYADDNEICHGKVVKDCIRGSHESTPDPVLVLGDSHAAQLNLFFDTVGRRNGQRFRIISASSCVTIPEFDVDRLPDWARAACRASIEFAKTYIVEAKVIVIAGMWQYQSSNLAFMKAFRAFLADADAQGTRVIVLAQIPMLSSDVLRLQRFERLGIGHRVSLHPEWLLANASIKQLVSEFKSARYVDFSANELFASPPFFDGRFIYHDNHHLNEIGANEYGKIAAPVFRDLIHPTTE